MGDKLRKQDLYRLSYGVDSVKGREEVDCKIGLHYTTQKYIETSKITTSRLLKPHIIGGQLTPLPSKSKHCSSSTVVFS